MMDTERLGAVVDGLDAALGFSKNLGPRLAPAMAADAAQHALRAARDELRSLLVDGGFDPWGSNFPWES
jgi:hypothetical protein